MFVDRSLPTLVRCSLLLISAAGCAASPTPEKESGDTGEVDTSDSTGDSDTGGDTAPPIDADGDGWADADDCDDADAAVHPGATETCDQRDEDCDGVADNGFSAPACLQDAPACALHPEPPPHPVPLVALSFDGDDWTANDGSLTGADWTVYGAVGERGDGAVGQGFELVSAGYGAPGSSYLQIASVAALHPDRFTVSAWVRPEDGSGQTIIANTMWDSGYRGFSFDLGYGKVGLRIGDGTAVANWSVGVPLGAWSWVAATFDGEVVSIYVNGELRSRSPLPAGFGPYVPASIAYEGATTGSTFTVGAYQNPLYYGYTGGIDELRYYEGALTGAELRREAELGRWRFEGEDPGQDDGPRATPLDIPVDAPRVCGAVGSAWTREAGDATASVPDAAALDLRAAVTVRALLRPDSLTGEAAIVQRAGAWSLLQSDGELVWRVVGADGSVAETRGSIGDRLGLWTPIVGTFDGTHARLFVDGQLIADVVPGFHTLAAGTGDLLVGEGVAGGLDEVVVSSLPIGISGASAPLLLGRWAAGDVTATTDGVPADGLATLDLSGSTERATTDDELRACLFVQAAGRTACPYRVGDALSVGAAVGGPLTLHVVLRPTPGAIAEPVSVLGLEGGPHLEVSAAGYALVWGDTRAAGGPAPADQWTSLSGVVAPDGLVLYVDGTEAGRAPFASPFAERTRFAAGTAVQMATRSGGADADAVRIDVAEVHGSAWDVSEVERHDAPWRQESHPSLVSTPVLQAATDALTWTAMANDALAALADPDRAPGTETYSHYSKASAALALATAASTTSGAESDAWLDATLQRLEDLDTGFWEWGWYQGRTLTWYAMAYDLIEPLLEAKEADDPWTWAPRHAALRRNLLAIAQQAWSVGGLDEDGGYSYGYTYSGTSWTSANARLMTSGGIGHVALVAAQADEGALGSGADLRAAITDDLFEVRPGEDEAQGTYLSRYLPDSGLFCEGTGYQDDVFYTLTPFLVDLEAAGGPNVLDDGELGAMYDADVLGMLPPGYAMLYATGWLNSINSVAFASAFATDPERAARWSWLASRQFDPTWTTDEPAFTSGLLGEDGAVLRSGWGPDDLWLMLLGKTTACNSSHAQGDAASLSMMAHGAWLLVDPGDGRDYRTSPSPEKEAWLQSAEGHNNVTVDGEGPGFVPGYDAPDDPAWITTSVTSGRAAYARLASTVGGSAADGGTDLIRHTWLVDNSFFVLVDELSSASTHQYAQQFHLGGDFHDGDGTATLAEDGFVWETWNPDGEAVTLHAVSMPGDLAITRTTATDGGTNVSSGLTWNHTYLRQMVDGADTSLVTVLLPQAQTESPPTWESLLAGEQVRALAVETDATGPVWLLTNSSGVVDGVDALLSDGHLAGSDGATWAFLADGTSVKADGGISAAASCSLAGLVLARDGAALGGTLAREAGGCTLDVGWATSPGAVEVDGAASAAWTWADGTLHLDPAPTGSFRVE